MAKQQIPVVLETLGNLLDRGYGLTAHCEACAHFVRLDLVAVAARLGRGRSYMG